MTSFTQTQSLYRAAISHYDYHWFWGLRYSNTVKPINIASQFDALLSPSSALLSAMREQQKRIGQRHFVVQYFYRLFNINNYAINSHTLAAFDAWQLSCLEEKVMPTDFWHNTKRNQSKKETSWAWVERSFNDLYASWSQCFSTNTDDVTETDMESYVMISLNLNDVEVPVDNQQFVVTAAMQSFLIKLGIFVNDNDKLSMSDIKTAYKKAALLAHPDKPNGSDKAFYDLQLTLDSLKNLIFFAQKDVLVTFENTQLDDYFCEAIAEVNLLIADLNRRMDIMKDDIDSIRHELDRRKSLYQSAGNDNQFPPNIHDDKEDQSITVWRNASGAF